MAREPLLSAKDIEIEFSLRGKTLKAIRRCSLDLYEGETLAIVGESGSGKSVFTKSFLGMLDANGRITGGSITYQGVDISKYTTEKEWLGIRGKKISMVMQDPMTSLNPLKKIGRQIEESIQLNGWSSPLPRPAGPRFSFATSRPRRWTSPSRPRFWT